mgnify:CR=1 FL=1
MLSSDSRNRIYTELDERGFSLTELIVVMAIFLTVMLITSSTFKTIVNQSSQQSKSVETQIEGLVGLEVLRSDMEQAGFGLPWSFQSTPTYAESDLGSSMPAASYWISGDANSFNDAPSGAPRPVQSANTKFNLDGGGNGAKYLVIKSTLAATNKIAKKWTNVAFANGTKSIATWGDATRDFASTDRVIVVKNNLNTTPTSRMLMVSASGFSSTFGGYSTLMKTHLDGDTFQIYGIGSTSVRMPFNRADYYVMRPATMPDGCAPNTGILYKSNISHSSGGYDPVIPLLDCVADLQVVYGLDTDGAGRVNLHTVTPPATATDQRAQIREIRAYILAQDGKRDLLYKYPSTTIDVGESFDGGATITGRRFDLAALIGTGWQNYRWKVYTIVVRPKNLIQ